ncbi:hypothetical protein [Limnohabitans sp. WS1]|uniref:hypothetical protein n=1 Tax=Limnohabitans sp. WS1 TaxID=1100726 RepID=UPI0013047DAF|nr:hypothetical protein [Limnohabitans sp. WS1]
MKNMNNQQDQCTGVVRCLWPMQWLAVVAIVALQACASTTPELDAQWGIALTRAKAAQSLPPTVQDADHALPGAGKPSATESLRGLEIHHKGLSAPAAIQAK